MTSEPSKPGTSATTPTSPFQLLYNRVGEALDFVVCRQCWRVYHLHRDYTDIVIQEKCPNCGAQPPLGDKNSEN